MKKGSLLLVILLSFSWIVYLQIIDKDTPSRQIELSTTERIPVTYNETQLNHSFNQVSAHKQISSVRGLIIPHHLVASDMIAEALLSIDSSTVDRIILIGPNHGEFGDHTAISSNVDWELKDGLVQCDIELYEELLGEGYIAEDVVVLQNEHAIMVPIPYLHYVFPQAKILPVTLSENQSIERLSALGERIAPSEDTLIIASIDFSHYLTESESYVNDEITISAIESMDIESLYEFDSDYLDSSSSIIVLLEAMKAAGSTEIEILGHSNSATIQGLDLGSTTSYYTVVLK